MRETVEQSSFVFFYFSFIALTILGRSKPIYETAVPFFWSSMFGKSVRYCGYASDFDDVVIHGDLAELKFEPGSSGPKQSMLNIEIHSIDIHFILKCLRFFNIVFYVERQ